MVKPDEKAEAKLKIAGKKYHHYFRIRKGIRQIKHFMNFKTNFLWLLTFVGKYTFGHNILFQVWQINSKKLVATEKDVFYFV